MKKLILNFYLALEGIAANKLRSVLTALGIVFGVGAVIAMLAIGTGAKQDLLNQMKLIGTNNIVIEAVVPNPEADNTDQNNANNTNTNNANGDQDKRPYSPGLNMKDIKAIQKVLPTIEAISPEVILPINLVRAAKLEKGRCIGVTNAFFDFNQLELKKGHFFHDLHLEEGQPVCIIGEHIQNRFFSQEDPIGQKIKCGKTWLTVIGVLQKRIATKESLQNLGIRDYNNDIYVPISTALIRIKNRALVGKKDIVQGRRNNDNKIESPNYHQLDKTVIRVTETKQLQASADIIGRLLKRRHGDIIDFEIQVPELLLKQQQRTQDTFNLVLAAIAGISLLVGGIGIMNIMLASVLERIKEIGIRRSLGATQTDIIYQFLLEAVFISLLGGILGVIIGVAAAELIASYADIQTIVSMWSIVLSFGVAASIGLIFGLVPAQKAAKEDPIKALRSD